jgi:CRISPR/Cas system-associated exonuclease Cas4 (RecB family)
MYKYVLNLPDPVGEPAIMGKCVHRAIEEIVKGATPEDALLTGWVMEADMFPLDLAEAEKMVKAAKVAYCSGTPEHHFTLNLNERLKIQGYIDLIINKGPFPYEIIDWKTGFRHYKVWENFQLPLYAWAVFQENPGLESLRCTLSFLRFRKRNTVLITRPEADKAKAWAVKTAELVERSLSGYRQGKDRKYFPANPQSGCSNCSYVTECMIEDGLIGIQAKIV